LFLERFQFKNKDSLQSRQDLDELGSKLGLWLKYNVNQADQYTHDFLRASSGSYRLEDCSWFDFWVQGTLRGQRESVWYLGINLSESGYLLIYTRLNSHTATREELSADLWYNLLAFRTLATSQGKKVVTVEDVYEEIVGILYSEEEKSRELEDIAISFSIFDREEGLIQSGHFGPSRPIVLGMENELTPQNEVVLSLSNGRVIRFWKVQTQLAQQGIYILPHDSSKIDNLRIEALKQNEFFEESVDRKRYLFLRHLNENLMESHIPRYFVAGTFSSKSDAKIRILDKAE
jgi:hypothetical protein